MQKFTPYQQHLLDRQRSFLSPAEQRRIAQAKLFAAALPELRPTLRLTLLSQPHKRSLMRPRDLPWQEHSYSVTYFHADGTSRAEHHHAKS